MFRKIEDFLENFYMRYKENLFLTGPKKANLPFFSQSKTSTSAKLRENLTKKDAILLMKMQT